MHRRETQRIPEFRLGQRERVSITVGQAHGLEAHVELTQEVGHPPISLTPTQASIHSRNQATGAVEI